MDLAAGFGTSFPAVSPDGDGFVGGAQGGFNFQSGTFVWGVEADISRTGLDGNESATDAIGLTATSVATRKLDWLGTLRLRGGVLLDPNSLVYVTGGLVYGHVKHSWSEIAPSPGLLLAAGGDSGWETGWTIGGGAEFAISRTMTVRSEYLYYDLGDTSYAAPIQPGIVGFPGTLTVNAENTGHVFRSALNFRF